MELTNRVMACHRADEYGRGDSRADEKGKSVSHWLGCGWVCAIEVTGGHSTFCKLDTQGASPCSLGYPIFFIVPQAMDGSLSLEAALDERLKIINCKPKWESGTRV